MRVIIAGSRDFWNAQIIYKAIADSGFEITKVVCGMAPGVDIVGRTWALDNGIPIEEYPARWETEGRAAGPKRNQRMAENAEALIVIHHNTPGSLDMLCRAHANGLKVYEVKLVRQAEINQ